MLLVLIEDCIRSDAARIYARRSRTPYIRTTEVRVESNDLIGVEVNGLSNRCSLREFH
jgi:hypothetical protein